MDAARTELVTILRRLVGESSNDSKDAVTQLKARFNDSHFTLNLHRIVGDSTIDEATRIVAARVFAESLYLLWTDKGRTRCVRSNSSISSHKNIYPGKSYLALRSDMRRIQVGEREDIQTNFFPILLKSYQVEGIRPALLDGFLTIAYTDLRWVKAVDTIFEFIGDGSNLDDVNWGLTLLSEYVKVLCVKSNGSDKGLDNMLPDIIKRITPLFDWLAPYLVPLNSPHLTEALRTILSICYDLTTRTNQFREILTGDELNIYHHWHVLILKHPRLHTVTKNYTETKLQKSWMLVIAWCLRSFSRLPLAYEEDIFIYLWSFVERWIGKDIELLKEALYWVFDSILHSLHDCWPLFVKHLERLIHKVLFPLMSASTESSTGDKENPVATVTSYLLGRYPTLHPDELAAKLLISHLLDERYDRGIDIIIDTMTDIFDLRVEDKLLLPIARNTEGAMRMFNMVVQMIPNSMFTPEESFLMFMQYIYPELSIETIELFPWLTARACCSVASVPFSYYAVHVDLAKQVFEAVMKCFNQQSLLTVRIMAAHALGFLGELGFIEELMRPNAVDICNQLYKLFQEYPLEVLTRAMNSIASHFLVYSLPHVCHVVLRGDGNVSRTFSLAKELLIKIAAFLTPICHDVEKVLALQFVKIVEIVTSIDYLTTEPLVPIFYGFADSLEKMLADVWDLYRVVVDALSKTKNNELDLLHFLHFLRKVVYHGFPGLPPSSSHVQDLTLVCLDRIRYNDSTNGEAVRGAYELLELIVLTLGDKMASIPQLLNSLFLVSRVHMTDDSNSGPNVNAFLLVRVLLAAIIADANTTLRSMAEEQFVPDFFEVWEEHEDKFNHMYGLKLQMLALMLIFLLDELESLKSEHRLFMAKKLSSGMKSLRRATRAPLSLHGNCNHSPELEVASQLQCKDCRHFCRVMLLPALPPRVSPLYDLDIFKVTTDRADDIEKWQQLYHERKGAGDDAN